MKSRRKGELMDLRRTPIATKAGKVRTVALAKIVHHAMARAQAWLESRGWHLAGDPGVGFRRLWSKTERNASGSKIAISDDREATTWEEQLSFEVFNAAENALLAAEQGRFDLALGFAFNTGMWHGISCVSFRVTQQKGAVRRGHGNLPDETYKCAILLATKQGSSRAKDAYRMLSERDRGAATYGTHLNRIRSVRARMVH
jgi:hypothetical protein